MMQGKQPYARKNGGSPEGNIMKGLFPYGVGIYTVQKGTQPYGLWRYMWSHLIYKVKLALWETFSSQGTHNTEYTRYSVTQWLALIADISLKKDAQNAVNLAVKKISSRINEYRRAGLEYYRSCLVVMTDRHPNGNPAELQGASMIDARKNLRR